MAKALEVLGNPEHAETAKFISLVDKFFDSLNVRRTDQGQKKLKKFLEPYTSPDDIRFEVHT